MKRTANVNVITPQPVEINGKGTLKMLLQACRLSPKSRCTEPQLLWVRDVIIIRLQFQIQKNGQRALIMLLGLLQIPQTTLYSSQVSITTRYVEMRRSQPSLTYG